MLVLGLSGGTLEYNGVNYTIGAHDSSACLIRDGSLEVAIEQERLDRSKYSNTFPREAIHACLDMADATFADIDAIGYYWAEDCLDSNMNFGPMKLMEGRGGPVPPVRQILQGWFTEEFGFHVPNDRLIFVPHHDSHAMATLAHSGMEDALVVVMDGQGELNSCTVYRGTTTGLKHLYSYPKIKSLGLLYLYATQHLGYGWGDEYKVMGLAPHGDPSTYREVFDSFYILKESGEYELLHGDNKFSLKNVPYSNFIRKAIENGVPPRRKGEQFSQQHKDFAAALQEMIERISLHLISHWAEITRASMFCFSGGVAHNSSLNGVIARSGIFRDIFIHPASHDGGAGEGAGLVVAHKLGEKVLPQNQMQHANFGPNFGTDTEIKRNLRAWSDLVEYEAPADLVDSVAALLADGAVVGWATGRSEFGPRALGNRSILADPRPKENRTRINAMVKKREGFRPFAPVVTSESAHQYFKLPDTDANYAFMSFVVPVLEECREKLGAVTHVDGTARVQILDVTSNPRFHRLVSRFGKLTGTPVLLNTSFNNNAEPIVQSVDDAIVCFLTTDIDYLAIEGFLISRKGRELKLDNLVPSMRAGTQLVKRAISSTDCQLDHSHEIISPRSIHPSASISDRLFSILERMDGIKTVSELVASTLACNKTVQNELYSLWQGRHIVMRPGA